MEEVKGDCNTKWAAFSTSFENVFYKCCVKYIKVNLINCLIFIYLKPAIYFTGFVSVFQNFTVSWSRLMSKLCRVQVNVIYTDEPIENVINFELQGIYLFFCLVETVNDYRIFSHKTST